MIGVINGLLIAKGKVTDFIATLGTLSVATGLALIASDGKPITVGSPELLRLTTGSVGIFGYPIILAAVIGVIAWFVMFRTRFGLHVQAVGGDEEAAVANGIAARTRAHRRLRHRGGARRDRRAAPRRPRRRRGARDQHAVPAQLHRGGRARRRAAEHDRSDEFSK